MAVTFRLLGGLKIDRHGCEVRVGRRRERCLLGVLLLQPGAPVRLDRLVDLLWDGTPPPAARENFYTHIARLRTTLGSCPDDGCTPQIRCGDGGYLIDVDSSSVDVHQFRAMARRAATLEEPAARADLARRALALWQGSVLEGDASDRLRERIAADLGELRLATTVLLYDAGLAAGRHDRLVGELALLVAEHPHHERFAAQLMLALFRGGRQAEAIDVFQRVRSRLADDLGVDPGYGLQVLYTAILRGDPDLRVTARPPVRVG